MTDSRLRELERRYRESPSVEAEAAWINARVQAGALQQVRVELAAYLGHEGACAGLGQARPQGDLATWVEGVQPLGGVEALRRVALAAAQTAMRLCPPGRLDEDTERRWKQARNYTLCPCHEHLMAAFLGELGARQPPPREMWLRNDLQSIAWPDRAAGAVIRSHGSFPADAVPTAALREAVGLEVGAWALRQDDPLRAGWAYSNCSVEEPRLRALAEDFSARDRRFHPEEVLEVLDPGFPSHALQEGPEAAVQRALAFVPPSEDTPEALSIMDQLSRDQPPRGGTCADFESYFRGGWVKAWRTPPDPRASSQFDLEF